MEHVPVLEASYLLKPMFCYRFIAACDHALEHNCSERLIFFSRDLPEKLLGKQRFLISAFHAVRIWILAF